MRMALCTLRNIPTLPRMCMCTGTRICTSPFCHLFLQLLSTFRICLCCISLGDVALGSRWRLGLLYVFQPGELLSERLQAGFHLCCTQDRVFMTCQLCLALLCFVQPGVKLVRLWYTL